MLAPNDLFKLQFIRDARLSPDGRMAACTISHTRDEERLEVWIIDLTTGEQRRLDYIGNSRHARWSPDGAWLAFVGDDRLRICDINGIVAADEFSPEGWKVEGAPSWSPDSERLVISLSRRCQIEGARRITSATYRADGSGFHDVTEQELWIVDRAIGDAVQLTQGLGLCFAPEWHPGGEEILFFASTSPVPFSSYSPRLLVIDRLNLKSREVLKGDWYVTAAHWLPNGRGIALAAARDSDLTIPVVDLWVVSDDGKETDLRTGGLIGNVGCRATHDMPVWDLTNANTFALLDGETAVVSVQRGGAVEVWAVSLSGPCRHDLVIGGQRTCIILDASETSDRLLFATTDLHAPTELATTRLDGSDERRLTQLNDAQLAHWPALRVEQFAYRSADELEIEAWYVARADLKGQLPTILFIHGGPFSATGHAYRYDFHMLAARGYGLVFANFRGSAGYGEDFVRAIMGDWCGRGYPDHMAAVDAVIERGWADPERLGVWGPSYGGSATCWIVGHTDRFIAAVAEAAGVNLTTRYYTADSADVFRRDIGGAPHEMPNVYRDRSPITYGHRAVTPTLLLHGEDDLRCPISEAEQFFRLLKDVGCTTELVRIPNCSHLGDSIGPLSARLAQNEALLDWFGRFL